MCWCGLQLKHGTSNANQRRHQGSPATTSKNGCAMISSPKAQASFLFLVHNNRRVGKEGRTILLGHMTYCSFFFFKARPFACTSQCCLLGRVQHTPTHPLPSSTVTGHSLRHPPLLFLFLLIFLPPLADAAGVVVHGVSAAAPPVSASHSDGGAWTTPRPSSAAASAPHSGGLRRCVCTAGCGGGAPRGLHLHLDVAEVRDAVIHEPVLSAEHVHDGVLACLGKPQRDEHVVEPMSQSVTIHQSLFCHPRPSVYCT